MKIKLEQLVNSFGAVERLSSLYLTGILNFRNGRTLEDARRLVTLYGKTEQGIIAQLKGETKEDGRVQFASVEIAKQFAKERENALAEDVEIYGEVYELDVAKFDLSNLSGAQMAALKWLITVIDSTELKEGEKAAAASN